MSQIRSENKYTFLFPACLGLGTGVGALLHNVGLGIGLGAVLGTVLSLVGWYFSNLKDEGGYM